MTRGAEGTGLFVRMEHIGHREIPGTEQKPSAVKQVNSLESLACQKAACVGEALLPKHDLHIP